MNTEFLDAFSKVLSADGGFYGLDLPPLGAGRKPKETFGFAVSTTSLVHRDPVLIEPGQSVFKPLPVQRVTEDINGYPTIGNPLNFPLYDAHRTIISPSARGDDDFDEDREYEESVADELANIHDRLVRLTNAPLGPSVALTTADQVYSYVDVKAVPTEDGEEPESVRMDFSKAVQMLYNCLVEVEFDMDVLDRIVSTLLRISRRSPTQLDYCDCLKDGNYDRRLHDVWKYRRVFAASQVWGIRIAYSDQAYAEFDPIDVLGSDGLWAPPFAVAMHLDRHGGISLRLSALKRCFEEFRRLVEPTTRTYINICIWWRGYRISDRRFDGTGYYSWVISLKLNHPVEAIIPLF